MSLNSFLSKLKKCRSVIIVLIEEKGLKSPSWKLLTAMNNIIHRAKAEHGIKEGKTHPRQQLSAKVENLRRRNAHIRKAANASRTNSLTKLIGEST